MQGERQCVQCEARIPDDRHQDTCSRSCAQKRAWADPNRKRRRTSVCETCAVVFVAPSHRRGRFCSLKCRRESSVGYTYTDKGGYVVTRISKSDPVYAMAQKPHGFVPVHRLVVARFLGRPLERFETVHHINGDKQDNRLENLQLRIGHHGSGRVACCRDCGSRNIVYEELP